MRRGRSALVRLATLVLVYLDSEQTEMGQPLEEPEMINRLETMRLNVRTLAEKIVRKYGSEDR